MDALEEFRSQIDALDDQILTLLHKRMQLIEHIGEFKKMQRLPYRDEARWQEILRSKSKQAEMLGLDKQFIIDLWNRIHEEALVQEQKI